MRARFAVAWRLHGAWLLAAVLVAIGAPPARAADSAIIKQVKAAYLFKFASYVEWPSGVFSTDDDPIVVAVIGDEDLAAEIERVVAGKQVRGRPVVVRTLSSATEVSGVQMLFFGGVSNLVRERVLDAVRTEPVLTVSDERGVGGRGGTMIRFVTVEQRIRFAVAMEPIRASGVHVSALMLSAAYDVAGDEP